jgi:hypothetical protein
MRSLRPRVVLVFALLGVGGCETAGPDCGCTVQVGSERRTLGCGERACVAGTLQVCDEDAEISEHGACTANNGAPTAQAGSASIAPPTPVVTHDCDALRTYCNGSCTSPPNPSADCQTTASAGDEQACQRWPLTNGILCHP